MHSQKLLGKVKYMHKKGVLFVSGLEKAKGLIKRPSEMFRVLHGSLGVSWGSIYRSVGCAGHGTCPQ